MPETIITALADLPFLINWFRWGTVIAFPAVIASMTWIFVDSRRRFIDATLWQSIAAVGSVLTVPALLARLHAGFAFEMRDALGLVGGLSVLGLALAVGAAIAHVATAEQAFGRPRIDPYGAMGPPVGGTETLRLDDEVNADYTRVPFDQPQQQRKTQFLRRDSPPLAMAWLAVEAPAPYRGTVLNLKADDVTKIGAQPPSDHILDDDYVGGLHLAITHKDGEFIAQDLASKSGTFVNGESIVRRALVHGDRIQIGGTRLVLVLITGTEQIGPAAQGQDAGAKASPTSRGSPEVPDGKLDAVHFSVTTPAVVKAQASFVLDVWAHTESERRQVIERARDALRSAQIVTQSKGPVEVARGTILTVRIKVEGLLVDDPEDVILWQGQVGNASFLVRVPPDAGLGPRPGQAVIRLGALQIARVPFVVEVGVEPADEARAAEVRPHGAAFASYASEDLDEVLARIQGIQKAAPNLTIFFDRASLHSGDLWEQELYRRIPLSDVFYLFWSKYARDSYWVEKEWRWALTTRGLDFIDPVPLVSPDEVPPPAELASKHFNDWVLAYKQAGRSRL